MTRILLHVLLLSFQMALVNSYTRASLLQMTTASTTDTILENSRRLQSKEKLKKFFSSENADDGCLICPESLSPLIRQTRVFGLFSEKVTILFVLLNTQTLLLPAYHDYFNFKVLVG